MLPAVFVHVSQPGALGPQGTVPPNELQLKGLYEIESKLFKGVL